MFLAFQNGVKNIQTAGYNGARTVYGICCIFQLQKRIVVATIIGGNTVLTVKSRAVDCLG